MNDRGLRVLRWVVAAVLGLQGLAFAAGAGGQAAEPVALRAALGGLEAAAAGLFLFRSTLVAGGVALGASLVMAAGLHVALGMTPPLGYVVDLAAIFAVVDSHRRRRGERGARG